MRPLHYAVIEITNRCNLRCPHCASTSGNPRENELSLTEISDLLTEIKALGGKEITIIGGEALLHPDWFEICSRVRTLGMELILISNGLPITRETTLPLLKELKPRVIGLSLDGATRESYKKHRGVDKFHHIMDLLRALRDDGHKNVNAITTFMRSNIGEFDAFVELFSGSQITWQVQLANVGGERFDDTGVITPEQFAWFVSKMKTALKNPRLRLQHMDDFGYCPLDPELAFLHETWHSCLAGRSLVGVRSDGDINGCLSLGDAFIEANLREHSLTEIWSSGEWFKELRSKETLLSGTCATCPHGPICQAGCTSIAYSTTGTIGENPYCIRTLETTELLNHFTK
ncbi:radical SAM protein [Myxococcota bacterium]|nr:radical SAM protein [Myxococcota bacterium]